MGVITRPRVLSRHPALDPARHLIERGRIESAPLVAVAGVLGVTGAAMVPSLAVELVDERRHVGALALSIPLLLAAGFAVSTVARYPRRSPLTARFGATVAGAVAAVFATALPFLLAGTFDRIDDTLVDATAAVSTTALTLAPPEDLSSGLQVWRATAQFVGGLGVLVMIVRVLPSLGGGGSEGSGGVSTRSARRLAPRTGATLARLGGLYGALAAALILAYLVAGLGFVDAVVHGLSTASTGGFSTRSASLGAFDSAAVDWVAAAGMFAAGISVPLLYRTARRRQLVLVRSVEFRIYAAVVGSLAVLLWWLGPGGLDHDGFRTALVAATSAVSTTGYLVDDPARWQPAGQSLILVAMMVGGMAASVGGGIKIVRIMAVVSFARRELQRQLHDRLVAPVRVGRTTMSDLAAGRIVGEITLSLLTLGAAIVVLAGTGAGVLGGVAASVAAFANGGPVFEADGPAGWLARLDQPGRAALAAVMFVGRTGVMPVLVAVGVALGPIRRRMRRRRRFAPERLSR